jgi:hypothetical protein
MRHSRQFTAQVHTKDGRLRTLKDGHICSLHKRDRLQGTLDVIDRPTRKQSACSNRCA